MIYQKICNDQCRYEIISALKIDFSLKNRVIAAAFAWKTSLTRQHTIIMSGPGLSPGLNVRH